jgi:hypothetical protein
MARRQHAVELSVGDIDQRLRSEKSHQQLGRRGFDSRHLQEGVFAVRGMLCSQLIRRRALLEVSHAPPSADADERPVNHPSIVGPPKRGRPPERGTPTVHRARAPTSAAIALDAAQTRQVFESSDPSSARLPRWLLSREEVGIILGKHPAWAHPRTGLPPLAGLQADRWLI